MTLPTKPTAVLTGHQGPIHALTFSKGQGQYILTGSADRSIHLYNPAKADPSPSSPSSGLLQTYAAHGYEVLDIAVTEDNSGFASVGGDKQVFLWDVSTARTLRRWSGHFGRVNCVDFGGEAASVVVSGSFDATIRIWDTRSHAVKPLQVLKDAKDSVACLRVYGCEIMAGSVDGQIRLYDLRMGIVSSDFVGRPVTSINPTRESDAILTSTLDSTIRMFDKGSGRLLRSYQGHQNEKYRIRSCLALNDSVVLSGSEDGYIYAWDLLNGTVIERLRAHEGKVASAVTWNGRKTEWASAGVDGKAVVWGSKPEDSK